MKVKGRQGERSLLFRQLSKHAMSASKATQHIFVEKHRPQLKSPVIDNISNAMVEEYLYNADSPGAYEDLDINGRNFQVHAEWIGTTGEDGAIYTLMMTLVILSQGKQGTTRVDIARDSALWNAIIAASDIKKTTIKVLYPKA